MGAIPSVKGVKKKRFGLEKQPTRSKITPISEIISSLRPPARRRNPENVTYDF